jgi:D-alanyl-D-alanine carboxypeptidase/D-alanyl-D-alanine-endopeptidase (penicillin-binding protein 4)
VAQDRLAALVGDGGVMLRSPSGEELVSLNHDIPLVPASILKIPLAQVALATLGEDFRFETHFYRNDSDDLLIRGLGDPFLVSEEIARIADTLAERGLQQIRRLVMDDSAFEPNSDLPIESGSDQPYAARNSALAVNFNTVNLAWAADGRLVTGETQTPLTALAGELGAQLSQGEVQRINLGDDPASGLRQAQQLFRYFLIKSGITVSDADFHQQAVTDEWSLFYSHRSSQSLRDNLDGMLRYSNNFIANQLFLTLGAQTSGYPATTEAARAALQQVLAELYGDSFGRDPQSLLMLEGSGLSRTQRSSAAGMMRILEVFKPYADLLPQVGGVLRKSGTLTGVYNFAGYIRGPDGLYPFVILTNQAVNKRAEILRLLQRQL